MGLTWATFPNFLPELPHANILFGPIWFGAIVALIVYARNHKINFDFVREDNNIDWRVKIERIKLEHDAWFKILVGLLAIYGLGLIYIYMYVSAYLVRITPCPAEQTHLTVAFALATIVNVLMFFIFVWEMLARIGEIRRSLLNVRVTTQVLSSGVQGSRLEKDDD